MVRVKAVAVAVLLVLLAVAASPGLLARSRSARGRLEGLFGIALGTVCVAGAVWLGAPLVGAERPPAAGLAALAAAPLLLVRFVGRRPARGSGTGPVGSHFFDAVRPRAPGRRDELEDEYVRLAVAVIARCDPFMPRAEARLARAKIDELLARVAALPDYAGIARATGPAVRRMLRGALDPRHAFSYRPPAREPGERLGLLVFLHGHGTNYLFVVHALRALCDRARLCLVAPSFGYGNWEAPSGVEAVERATRFGLATFGADPARVLLGGLSQGGAGVSRAAAAHPSLFAGLIFISPTMEPAVIASAAFRGGWNGRPVLVIQGQRDRNVHPRTVDRAVGLMDAAGVVVTEHRDPDGGHFLLFAELDEVTEVICSWAGAVRRPGC